MAAWRFLTAGESHGPMLVAIVEGLPAGMVIDEERLAFELARRQQGYGRGGRMKIEQDRARIVAGVRHGRTIGAPVALTIDNRDHASWSERMQVAPLAHGQDGGPRVTLPRPGHADLAGAFKIDPDDLRDVLERASARETAARTAVGALAKEVLALVDVRVGAWVRSIHEVSSKPLESLLPDAFRDALLLARAADASDVRTLDASTAERMRAAVDAARKRRDTIGGTFEVVATGVPPGLGSYGQWDQRLDARLVRAVTSIPAVKAAEVGDGWEGATKYGSEVHDPIVREGPALVRTSNHAGGTEGGISNGQPVVIHGAMKPIATVPAALPSVDLATGEPGHAHVERSDTCAVPAAAVVGEAVVAITLAEALLEAHPSDKVESLQASVRAAWRRSRKFGGHVWLTGLPGSGKSTLAPRLAERLGLPCIDVDAEVVREAGRSVADVFRDEGEAGFRARELAVIRRVARGGRSVVALGGGAVMSALVRDVLRRTGDVVWLDVPLEVLAMRLDSSVDRPLLPEGSIEDALRALEAARRATYAMVSDVVVDGEGLVEELVERVPGALGGLR